MIFWEFTSETAYLIVTGTNHYFYPSYERQFLIRRTSMMCR